MTPIYFRGKRVMAVRNGVAYRFAKASEQMRKPPAWSFHTTVLRQLEAAGVCHLAVVDERGRTYSVPWATFMAMSVPTDRGFGPQRYLPLQYWSIDGAPPERRPRLTEPVATQTQLDLGV